MNKNNSHNTNTEDNKPMFAFKGKIYDNLEDFNNAMPDVYFTEQVTSKLDSYGILHFKTEYIPHPKNK